MNCREFLKWIEQQPSPGVMDSLPQDAFGHLQNCHSCSKAWLEVTKTLEIPDREKEYQAGPYFYTRLRQKMENRQRIGTVWGIPARLLQPSVLFLLLFAGISMGIFTGSRAGLAGVQEGTQSMDSTIQILADEYFMSEYTITYESEYYGNNSQ